jgi:hypothetical protein
LAGSRSQSAVLSAASRSAKSSPGRSRGVAFPPRSEPQRRPRLRHGPARECSTCRHSRRSSGLPRQHAREVRTVLDRAPGTRRDEPAAPPRPLGCSRPATTPPDRRCACHAAGGAGRYRLSTTSGSPGLEPEKASRAWGRGGYGLSGRACANVAGWSDLPVIVKPFGVHSVFVVPDWETLKPPP